MLNWLIFAVVGRLLILLGMRFHLPERIEKIQWIALLHGCSLCMGMWIYSGLAYFMKIDMLTEFHFWYVPVISELVTGAFTTFVVWIFEAGYRERFLNITVI